MKQSVVEYFKTLDMDSIKDDEFKRLTKNVKSEEDIKPIAEKLHYKHLLRWFDRKRSAEEMHKFLGLPTGDALLKSPLVWFWLDYTFYVNYGNPEQTMKILRTMFKTNEAIGTMFEGVKMHDNFHLPSTVAKVKEIFVEQLHKMEFTDDEIRGMFKPYTPPDRPSPSNGPTGSE